MCITQLFQNFSAFCSICVYSVNKRVRNVPSNIVFTRSAKLFQTHTHTHTHISTFVRTLKEILHYPAPALKQLTPALQPILPLQLLCELVRLRAISPSCSLNGGFWNSMHHKCDEKHTLAGLILIMLLRRHWLCRQAFNKHDRIRASKATNELFH